MRKLILIMLFLQLGTAVRAQIFKEWFRQKKTQKEYLLAQIAALKVHIEFLQKGYEIANDGLTLIGDIKNGDFKLHKDYFASLKKISPAVSGYVRVKDIVALQVRTYESYVKYYNAARESGLFSREEVDYILRVYVRLLEDCSGLMDQLIVLTTAGKLEMKDDERIKSIDGIFKNMQSNYTFSQGFGKEAMILAASRKTGVNNTATIRELHGINN